MKYRLKLLILLIVPSAVFCLLPAQAALADSCVKTLYIDGEKIDEATVNQGLQWTYDRITIGAEGDRWWLYNEYIGNIDEFAIYAGVLSDPCIAAHYAAKDSNAVYTAVVQYDNPLLWLRFEDPNTSHDATATNSGWIGINGQYVTTGGEPITQVGGIFADCNDCNAINIPDAVGHDTDEEVDRQGHCVDVWDGNGDFGEELDGDVTIELWIQSPDYNTMPGNDYPRLFQHNSAWDNPSGYGLMINNSPNEIGVMGGGYTDYMGFTYDLNDGNWHHIVVTYDSTYIPQATERYPVEIMKDNPVLYIRFEEDDPCDYSGNNYWVEASDVVTIEQTKGSMGKAAYLNGGWVAAAPSVNEPCEPVDYNHAYAFAPNDITIEFWLYTPNPDTVDDYAGLFIQSDGEYAPGMSRANDSDNQKCRMQFGRPNHSAGPHCYSSPGAWAEDANDWHHYVVEYNEIPDVNGEPYQINVRLYRDKSIYKNSTYGPGTPCTGLVGPEMDHILLGHNDGNRVEPSNTPYRQYIDEFAIYEGILDPNRINAHYEAWAPKDCNELWDRQMVEPGPATVDRNKDCKVDFWDFASFALSWDICNDPCDANCVPPEW